jgi:hypothetical protein
MLFRSSTFHQREEKNFGDLPRSLFVTELFQNWNGRKRDFKKTIKTRKKRQQKKSNFLDQSS